MPVYNPGEADKLRSALAALPANCGYSEWLAYGMALADLQWSTVETGGAAGTDHGFELWDAWSSTGGNKYPGRAALERKWATFNKDYQGVKVTVASIYDAALARGWQPPISVNLNNVNGLPIFTQVFPELNGIKQENFVDFSKGRIRDILPTCKNTRIALHNLGVQCRYDLFHDRLQVSGQVIHQWAGEIADSTVLAVRSRIRERWPFEPSTQTTIDALTQECLEHAYDPVCDYLDGLQWDGVQRLPTWMRDYLGADDTPLNAMIGGLALVAAVRRARRPGCKFDHVIVLEGLEGLGKSSAVAVLAGQENFSDQAILALDERRQQEAIQGVWLYEVAELSGLRRAEIEHVKTFVTRTVDRARPAYGRTRVDKPRRCIFFATTNDERYLISQTGNRRFWPVGCTRVLLEALADVRDQLWAEASAIEARGVSLALPERFWGEAVREQEQRRVIDPWEDDLARVESTKHVQEFENGELRITTSALVEGILNISTANKTPAQYSRIAAIMRKLGWRGPYKIRVRLFDGKDETIALQGFTKQK